MKTVASLFLVAALSGCATSPQLPRVVEVPVVIPCLKPPMPVRPVLAISSLTDDSLVNDIQRAYVATVEALEGYISALEPLVGTCKFTGTAP